MASLQLQGRVLFITGGASGIGAEVARQAAKKGAKLALVDVDVDAAKRLAESLPEAIGIQADVRDYDSLESAVNETVETFGGIDVAMANAGIEIAATARSVPLVEMERIADINFTGVFRTVRATLPHLVDRQGYLLITASLAAIMHAPPLSHYSATKAGVEAFGDAVRMEYRHKGVDVGVAYFGFIDTPMVQRGRSDPILAKFEELNNRSPIARTYTPQQAAARVIRGIENRSRRVMQPPWIRALMVLRAAMPRVIDRGVDGQMVGQLIDELDQRALHGTDDTPSREFHERMLS